MDQSELLSTTGWYMNKSNYMEVNMKVLGKAGVETK